VTLPSGTEVDWRAVVAVESMAIGKPDCRARSWRIAAAAVAFGAYCGISHTD